MDGTVFPLTNGIWFWSAIIATTGWTLVQKYGDPAHGPASSQLNETPWCLALVGPTASGKSAAAMAIARRVPSEIISVDSALVYRGMDIGTAKPIRGGTRRGAAPPDRYPRPAAMPTARPISHATPDRLVDAHQRTRQAGIAGGRDDAVCQGADRRPARHATGRQAGSRRARTGGSADSGWPALHARLALVDPITAARLAPNDSQRIQRALEVHELTGRPLSELAWRGQVGSRQPSRFAELPLLSLEPRQRNWLHGRIAQRFDAMLARGFPGRGAGLACARRPASGPALDALRRLPPGLAGDRQRMADRRAARARHHCNPPTGQTPDDLAAQHAASAA